MRFRKIAVLGSFAAGAALAVAPLASAAPTDPVTDILGGEISSLNSLFTLDADLAGDGTAVIPGTAAQPFDTIPLVDAPDTAPATTLDYELYGVNPIAQAGGDPGSYDLYNGALGKFDDALNIELYAAENANAVDPNAADFIGSASSIATGLGEANATDAADYFYNFAIGDLGGFLGTNLSFLDLPV